MRYRWLILGFGSDLRGDDMLGRRAARALEGRWPGDRVRVIECASLTPDLAADVADTDRVLFIDCDALAGPGSIARREVVPVDDKSTAMVHFLDPPALLSWAKLLYGAEPRGVMLTMGGQTFECSDELSGPVAAAMPELVRRAEAEVEAHLSPEEVARA